MSDTKPDKHICEKSFMIGVNAAYDQMRMYAVNHYHMGEHKERYERESDLLLEMAEYCFDAVKEKMSENTCDEWR